MVDKKVSMVVKVEYEIEENREKIWSAYIMSHSQDEAVKYLAKFLKKTIKVTGIGIVAPRVDAMTDAVRESITGVKTKKAKGGKGGKGGKADKADIEPSKEQLEKLEKARQKALEDLEKQGIDIIKPVEEKKEEKPKPKTKRNLNIGKK